MLSSATYKQNTQPLRFPSWDPKKAEISRISVPHFPEKIDEMPHAPIPKEFPTIRPDILPDWSKLPMELPPATPFEIPDEFSKPLGPWIEVPSIRTEHFPKPGRGTEVWTPDGPPHWTTIPHEFPSPKGLPMEVPQHQEWLLGK